MGNVGKFRIRPRPSTWIDCWIWNDLESMRQYVQKKHPDWNDKTYDACYLPVSWHFKNKCLVTRKLGEIHFYVGQMGVGIVSHEIQHFLSDWVEAWGWDCTGENFEDIAYLAGSLNTQFWVEFYKQFKPQEL